MKRLIAYAVIVILCSGGAYLAGYQRGAYRSAMNLASFSTGDPPANVAKAIPEAVRDAQSTIIIEVSERDSDKPYLYQNTRYSLAEADTWLASLSARYGSRVCVVVVAHEHDAVGEVSAIMEIAKKYNDVVYATFLSHSNATWHTVAFSEIKHTPDWEWFMQKYHLSMPAPNYPFLGNNKAILPTTTPLPANSSHN